MSSNDGPGANALGPEKLKILRDSVETINQHLDEIEELQARVKDVLLVVKSHGMDPTVVKKAIVALRKRAVNPAKYDLARDELDFLMSVIGDGDAT